jgi:general secretion pathway protein M
MSILGHPARGRVAALAVLAVLLAALWTGPVSAYLDLVGDGADRLEQRALLLQRYRTLASMLPAPETETLRSSAGSPAVMLPDTPEAQAVAMLQESVKAAASASRVRINSLQVLRSETLASAVKIGVRIRAAGDVAGVARLLFAIEAARPVLYPDNLQIQAHAATPGKAPEALDFQLDISGFKPGGSS